MAFLQLLTANVNNRGGMTPVCQFTMANDFAKFLEVNNITFDMEAGAAWLMLDAVDRAQPNVVPRVLNDQPVMTCMLQPLAGAAGAAGGAAGPEYLDAHVPPERELAQGVPRDAFRLLMADRNKALFWVLNLTACHQVKPMRAQNISNWFRMTARATLSGRTILRVIDFAAVTLPNIMSNNEMRTLLDNNQFMIYHTAYSSTAKLAAEMLDVCPPVTDHIFSAATREAVNNSLQDQTNRELNANISQQIVLATYAYLTVFGKLPDAWYQGEKALAALPANRYAMYRAIFTKVRALTVNTTTIDAAADINALITALGQNLANI